MEASRQFPFPTGDVHISPAQTSSEHVTERSLRLALTAARVADDNRGRDIVILDTRRQTCLFDYFVLATGTSRRQLHALSDEIERVVREELQDQRLGIEGFRESQWILLDYGDVVIHLFDQPTREFYGLEDLWSDAVRVPFQSSQPEQRGTSLVEHPA